MNRTIPPFAAVALVALIGVGCSKAPAHSDTARGDTASAVTSTTLDKREQGVKFADCIREHTVTDFPDPDRRATSCMGSV